MAYYSSEIEYHKYYNRIDAPPHLLEEALSLAKKYNASLRLIYDLTFDERTPYINITDAENTTVDFSVLAKYPELSDFSIENLPKKGKILNVEQIYKMKNLRHLMIRDKRMPPIDVSKIPNLDGLTAICTAKNIVNLGKATKMRGMRLWSYRGKDFSELSNLKNLTTLELINPTIESLNGIENMPQLTYIDFYGTKNLNDVSLLEKLPNLRHISLPKKFQKEQEKIRELIISRHSKNNNE